MERVLIGKGIKRRTEKRKRGNNRGKNNKENGYRFITVR